MPSARLVGRTQYVVLAVAVCAATLVSSFASAQPPVTAGAAPVLLGNREIETQLIPSPRATSPGSAVRLIYSVINYEETAILVRLRLHLPDGWTHLKPELTDREFTIEAFDEIEGEILVAVAREARVGDRQLLKLWTEVVGEPGVYEGQNFVSITRSGGVKPGVVALTGNTTVGLSRISNGLPEARTAGGVSLTGRLDRQTTVAVSVGRDMAENLTNYRYTFEPVKVSGTIRRGSLDATFGNLLFSSGNAITGPLVRGRGAVVRRLSGRFVGDFLVAQPTTYAGEASGYLVRGRAGLSAPLGSVSFVASDFSRPVGYTTLLPVVTVLDPDEAERQEIERRLAAGEIRNRVLGAGLEGELRPGKSHRLSARVGAIHLASAAGVERTAPAAEASYGYSGRVATLSLRWRETPPAVPGVQLGGDERWADATVRVYREVRFFAQAFSNLYETTGGQLPTRSRGGAVGTRYIRGTARVELRGNYRESAFTARTIRRTGAVSVGVPLGPFSLNGTSEIGETESVRGNQALAFYRADLRMTREAATASLSISRNTTAGITLNRADLLGSFKIREYELSGGAWMTRGYRTGGHPGVWATAALPIPLAVTAIVGVEYAPLTYTAEPGWRASVRFRRPLVIPLRFLTPKPLGDARERAHHFVG